jgi:acyl dehydratase
VAAYRRAVAHAPPVADGEAYGLQCFSPMYPAIAELRRTVPDLVGRNLIHIGHRVELVRPLRCGMALVADISIGPMFTLGARPAFDAQVTVTDADEDVTVATMSGTFGTDGPAAGPVRRLPPSPRAVELVGSAQVPLPAEVADHYADACGDRDPLHLDDEAARGAGFGLPGRIVQGLCVLANAQAAASRIAAGSGSDSGSGEPVLREVGGRFTHWVLPGQTLTVEVSSTPEPQVYALRGRVDDRVVLKGAWLAVGG